MKIKELKQMIETLSDDTYVKINIDTHELFPSEVYSYKDVGGDIFVLSAVKY